MFRKEKPESVVNEVVDRVFPERPSVTHENLRKLVDEVVRKELDGFANKLGELRRLVLEVAHVQHKGPNELQLPIVLDINNHKRDIEQLKADFQKLLLEVGLERHWVEPIPAKPGYWELRPIAKQGKGSK